MNRLICRCCGETIHEEGNALSRNPNVCASCSSLADGMNDSNVPGCDGPVPDRPLMAEAGERVLEPAAALPLGGA